MTNSNSSQNDFENASIDSLKIRIRSGLVKMSPELKHHQTLVTVETGEEDPESFKDKAFKHEKNGIKTKALIELQQTAQQTTKEYLTILINAKMLGSRYLEGIIRDNIQIVYDYLMSLKFADFSLLTFLTLSECTDIDFKLDLPVNNSDAFFKAVIFQSKSNNKKDYGHRYFNQKRNQGVEFANRKTQAFTECGFLKMYNKKKELLYHSSEFFNTYLKDQRSKLENIIRIETTVKNKRHLRQLNIANNSLEGLLNISVEQKQKIFSIPINAHLNPIISPLKKPAENMSPTAIAFLKLMHICVLKGVPRDIIIEGAVKDIITKNSKWRIKNQLIDIYYNNFSGTEEDNINQEIYNILSMLGLKKEE